MVGEGWGDNPPMNTLARVGILSLTVLLAGCTVTRLRGSPEASGVVTRADVPVADTPICMRTSIKSVCEKTDAAGRFHLPATDYIEIRTVMMIAADPVYSHWLVLGSKPSEIEIWRQDFTWEAVTSVNLQCDLDKPAKYGGYCKEE